jgi:hypothetical protein
MKRLYLVIINVQCVYYQDMPHAFCGSGNEDFIQNTVQFFNQNLKTSE